MKILLIMVKTLVDVLLEAVPAHMNYLDLNRGIKFDWYNNTKIKN